MAAVVVVVRMARVVSILLVGALVAAGCATSFDVDAAVPPTPTPEADDGGATLASGDCLSEEGLRVIGVEPVPCDRPHIAEVFAVDSEVEPVSAPWPMTSPMTPSWRWSTVLRASMCAGAKNSSGFGPAMSWAPARASQWVAPTRQEYFN